MNFISAFLLLFGGILIATIILICENAYSRFLIRSKNKDKKDEKNEVSGICLSTEFISSLLSSVKDSMEYESMLTFEQMFKSNPREKLLEMRIENLQTRIHELERRSSLRYSIQPDIRNRIQVDRSSFVVLPITYNPVQEPSPQLEIVPYSSGDQRVAPTVLVEQSKTRACETVV